MQAWPQDQAVLELKQRLDRAEQALLKLDRRMQLVERNELGRMGGVTGNSPFAAREPAFINNMSSLPPEEATATHMASVAQTNMYQNNIQPVSSPRDGVIRSSVQAGPNTLGNGLPSLADPRTNTQPMPSSAGQLAIWTVRYEPEKVWPDRSQLPDSRTVVEALRNSRTLTVVARGPNPNSQTFQDRVRALSRYLAKVASLETVPISALATPGLDANTIEVLATP
jgi:hypothetical protein